MMYRVNAAVKVSMAILLLGPSLFHADSVKLADGSVINGRVESVGKDKLTIDTAFAGLIEIDRTYVASFATDDKLFLTFASGNTLFGTVSDKAGRLVVNTADGAMDMTRAQLVAAWQEGQPDPTAPPPPPEVQPGKWSYEVAGDLRGKSGNTEQLSYGGKAVMTLRGPEDRLMFYGGGRFSEENKNKTREEVFGGVDFEHNITKHHSWYARVNMESDRLNDLELRITAALGYGYYFLNEETHVLRGRIGALFRHESYENRDAESTAGVDLGLHHMLRLKEWGKLVSDLTYNPSVEDAQDYLATHETALDIPLARSDFWKLRLGVRNEFDSTPARGKDRLDTTYFAQIVLQWE